MNDVAEEIKRRLKIRDVYPYSLQGTRGRCMHHDNSDNPSFEILEGGEAWYCHSNTCKMGGDVINLIAHKEGINNRDAFFEAADRCGIELNERSREYLENVASVETRFQEFMEVCHEVLLDDQELLESIMDRRGWSLDTIKDKKIGYVNDEILDRIEDTITTHFMKKCRFYDANGNRYFGERIVYPYLNNQNEAVYFTYRGIDEPAYSEDSAGIAQYTDGQNNKYVKHKCRDVDYIKNEIYGLDSVFRDSDKDLLLITEGAPDSVTAYDQGYKAISPITTGFSDEQKEEVYRKCSWFDEIVVIFDTDLDNRAGQTGAEKLMKDLLRQGLPVKNVKLIPPEGRTKYDLTNAITDGMIMEEMLSLKRDAYDVLFDQIDPNDYRNFDKKIIEILSLHPPEINSGIKMLTKAKLIEKFDNMGARDFNALWKRARSDIGNDDSADENEIANEYGAEIEFRDEEINEVVVFNRVTNKISKKLPLHYKINGRYFNYKYGKWFFKCDRLDDKKTLIDSAKLNSILHQTGASRNDLNKINNYVTNTDDINVIETIANYGYDPNRNEILMPQDYVSENMIGWGLEFFEKYNSDTDGIEEGKEAYLGVLEAARHGIGDTKAILISAFSLASPFQKLFKQTEKILGMLGLIGKKMTSKTTASEYLGKIGNYECLHKQEELTPAILSQLGSCAPIPMVIDDCDKLQKRILSTLLVVLTSTTKRRRSNKNGTRRDAAEFERTLMFTGNNIPIFLENKPALLDRCILMFFNTRPTNVAEWKRAQTRFDNCDNSILNYLVHQDWDWDAMIQQAKQQNNVIISQLGSCVPPPMVINEADELRSQISSGIDNARKAGMFAFINMGILILEKLDVDLPNNIRTEIKQMILETNECGAEGIKAEIMGFLDDSVRRRQQYEELKSQDGISHDRLERFKDQGLCENKIIDGTHYYLIDDRLFRTLKRNISINISKVSELKQLLETGGLECTKEKTWISYLKKQWRCLCVKLDQERINWILSEEPPDDIIDINDPNRRSEADRNSGYSIDRFGD